METGEIIFLIGAIVNILFNVIGVIFQGIYWHRSLKSEYYDSLKYPIIACVFHLLAMAIFITTFVCSLQYCANLT